MVDLLHKAVILEETVSQLDRRLPSLMQTLVEPVLDNINLP
jgi:hypothetical protein